MLMQSVNECLWYVDDPLFNAVNIFPVLIKQYFECLNAGINKEVLCIYHVFYLLIVE